MSIRNEVRQRIAALNGAEFDYSIAKGIKNGGQALNDLHELGEVTLLRVQKDEGRRGYKVYKAVSGHSVNRNEAYQLAPELIPFLLGGNPKLTPPKGTVREHRVGL